MANRINKIFSELLLVSTAVGASGYVHTIPISLQNQSNNFTMSYWLSTGTSGATFNLEYEVSNSDGNNKQWFPVASNIVTGQALSSGVQFTITGGTRADPTVFSGTHGISTGDFVDFDNMEQDSDWIAFNSRPYKVTVVTAGTFSVQEDSSGFDAELGSTQSGTGTPVSLASANVSSPILAKFMRFKVSETAGIAGSVTLGITWQ